MVTKKATSKKTGSKLKGRKGAPKDLDARRSAASVKGGSGGSMGKGLVKW
jgi:hypothetical protein